MRSPTDTEASLSTMGETKYTLQAHAGLNPPPTHPQGLTPYSPVSSFNLPSFADNSLITPVTTRSPTIAGASEPDREIKLSPSTLSPSFHFLPNEDNYSSGRYELKPPMKHKSHSGPLAMSSYEHSFPQSPLIPEPFYGSFGVSTTVATPVSVRSEPSPHLNLSPHELYSGGGFSNRSPSFELQPTPGHPTTFGPRSQAPILIAPKPSSLRAGATRQEGGSYRPRSLPSMSRPTSFTKIEPGLVPDSLEPLPPRGKKRKATSRESVKHMVIDESKMTEDERTLYDLALNGELQWKEVVKKYEQILGEQKSDAALQMRFGRLVKRLRLWTDREEQALTLAVEELQKGMWETISRRMLEFGCGAKWPAEFCERKWLEMNPAEDYMPQDHNYGDWDPHTETCSDGRASVCLNMSDPTAMDESRARAASDSQMWYLRQHRRLQPGMIEEHPQNDGWELEG